MRRLCRLEDAGRLGRGRGRTFSLHCKSTSGGGGPSLVLIRSLRSKEGWRDRSAASPHAAVAADRLEGLSSRKGCSNKDFLPQLNGTRALEIRTRLIAEPVRHFLEEGGHLWRSASCPPE